MEDLKRGLKQLDLITIFSGKYDNNSPPKLKVVDKRKIKMRRISCKLAKRIIEKYHYLHSCPKCSLALGFFYEGWLSTVIVFGQPSSRLLAQSIWEGGNDKNTWELLRLYSFDWSGKNTESRCISLAIKYIKKYHPEVKVLIAFADPSVGHVGTIYKASNWIFVGAERGRGHPAIYIDGKRRHPRELFDRHGTSSVSELMKIYGNRMKAPELVRKYKYVYPLDKTVKLKCVGSVTEAQPSAQKEGGGSSPTPTHHNLINIFRGANDEKYIRN